MVFIKNGLGMLKVKIIAGNFIPRQLKKQLHVICLDAMLGGKGYFRGSSILVSGMAGTGKTSLSAAFAEATCPYDQHAITHAWVGRALLVMYQGKEAIVSARRARQLITAETPSTDVAFIDAILAESQADVAAAEKRYGQLATLRLDDPTAQIELADFLKRQNREQEAIGAYREALRRDGGQVRPHVDLCQLYTRVDEYPLADQEARIALEKYRAASHKSGEAQALSVARVAQSLVGRHSHVPQPFASLR